MRPPTRHPASPLLPRPPPQAERPRFLHLAPLLVPEADAVAEAGRLVKRLPELWAAADLPHRRRLLLAVLDAVGACPEQRQGVEGRTREARAVVSMRPKAAFGAVLVSRSTDRFALVRARTAFWRRSVSLHLEQTPVCEKPFPD